MKMSNPISNGGKRSINLIRVPYDTESCCYAVEAVYQDRGRKIREDFTQVLKAEQKDTEM